MKMMMRLRIYRKSWEVQLHFCTWPPDFCQMYMYKMYKNVQNMYFPVWKFPG